VRKHTGCRTPDRACPIVVHEAEFVSESVEFVRLDGDIRILRAVVQHRVLNWVCETLATGQRHHEEVVHAAPGDELVDHGAFGTPFVFERVQDFGINSFVYDNLGDFDVQFLFGQGVHDSAHLLSQHGLKLSFAHPVPLDYDALRLDGVEQLEALGTADDTVCDFRTEFLLQVLCFDIAGVLAEILVQTGGEAHDALACAVLNVNAANHGRHRRALGLVESPRSTVVKFGNHLGEQFADNARDALAARERTGEHHLRGDGKFADGESLGEFVQVHVILLSSF
jgi:hypothetical protein